MIIFISQEWGRDRTLKWLCFYKFASWALSQCNWALGPISFQVFKEFYRVLEGTIAIVAEFSVGKNFVCIWHFCCDKDWRLKKKSIQLVIQVFGFSCTSKLWTWWFKFCLEPKSSRQLSQSIIVLVNLLTWK